MWHDHIHTVMQELHPGASPATDYIWLWTQDGPFMSYWDETKLGPMDLGLIQSLAEEIARKAGIPGEVSESQFMRAAVKVGMVTALEAEAYLARGELPAFVERALYLLPEDMQVDARLKSIGASTFYREDDVFGALVAGGVATNEEVDQLFMLAGTL